MILFAVENTASHGDSQFFVFLVIYAFCGALAYLLFRYLVAPLVAKYEWESRLKSLITVYAVPDPKEKRIDFDNKEFNLHISYDVQSGSITVTECQGVAKPFFTNVIDGAKENSPLLLASGSFTLSTSLSQSAVHDIGSSGVDAFLQNVFGLSPQSAGQVRQFVPNILFAIGVIFIGGYFGYRYKRSCLVNCLQQDDAFWGKLARIHHQKFHDEESTLKAYSVADWEEIRPYVESWSTSLKGLN